MRCRIPSSLLVLALTALPAWADGERVALCVGVNEYDHVNLKALNYAEADATKFAAALRDTGYKVVLMTNATGKADAKLKPTKENIDAQIKALLKDRKRDDIVVVALAGHGTEFDKKNPDCYFFPVDAKPFKEQTKTLVSIDSIYTQLGQCGAGGKILLADCCRLDPNPGRGRGENDVLDKVPPKGVLALYACSPQEQAFEYKQLRHGVFFYHVLEGLRRPNGAAGDLEFEALALHVRREVPKTVVRIAGADTAQNPNMKAADIRGAPVVLLTKASRELLADAQAVEDWMRTRGSSEDFYKEFGPKRVAAWKAAAEQGSAAGMLLYAGCLYRGKGVAKDEAAALKWYRKAAALGCALSTNSVGYFHSAGVSVKKDETEAVKWYRQAAALGNPVAMTNLAINYAEGTGVEKDETAALRWCEKAAEMDYTPAMNRLGWHYTFGRGVEKDPAAAFKWYQKSAAAGGLAGMDNVGMCYYKGTGVTKDAKEAVKWFRQAAEAGWAESMTMLGALYLDGIGVAKDAKEGVRWFQKAADLGQVSAMAGLGDCYFEGTGVAKDLPEAVKWYQKAAGLKDTQAMYKLGQCYLHGTGVREDKAEAVKWVRKAAEAGRAEAMTLLGALYLDGTGVAKDAKEGVKWLHKAADLGDVSAVAALGECYLEGIGVPKDVEMAVKLLRKAAAAGDAEAKQTLKRLGKE